MECKVLLDEIVKRIVTSVVVLAVSAGIAAEIAFKNGAGDGDLSKSANWDGDALPGAANVGVVDVATCGTAYSFGTDAALGGLKFTNVASKVTIGGAGVLMLGADGLLLDAAGGLEVTAPLATSADQSWNFGGGEATFKNTISGTFALTLTNSSMVHFRTAPCYGGAVTSRTPIKYYDRGAFCNTFKGSARVYFMMTGNVELAYSTLFPCGSYSNTAWDPNTEWVRQDGITSPWTYGRLLIDSGTFSPGGVGFCIGAGYVRQIGGVVDTTTSSSGIAVGDYHAYGPTNPGWGQYPAEYFMVGGTITGHQIFLGMYYSYGAKPALFHQTGGTVTVGRVAVGAGNQSAETAYSQFLMGGGTLDIGMTRNEWSRMLSIPGYGGQGSSAPGVFTQTNGTVRAYGLQWGSGGNYFADAVSTSLDSSYGRFELKDGRFELGAGGIVKAGNWCRSSTNSMYVLDFSGGTFAPQTEQIGNYQWQIKPSGNDFTFENEKQYTQAAPVFGSGTLRKTGSGLLTLSDATEFRGSVKVEEGTLALAAAVPAATDDAGAIIWAGDDIASKNSLEDNEGVENLTSTDGNHTFLKQPTPVGSTIGNFSNTVTVSTDASFNGHKSLYLHYNYLKIPAADNPLNGATNFTVVLVYRSNKGNWCCSEDGNSYWRYAAGILGRDDDASFTITHTREHNISSTPRFCFGTSMNGDKQMMSQMDYHMNDNRAHVAIVSYSNNCVKIIADGFTSNFVHTSATTFEHVRRFYNKDLNLGGIKDTAYTHVNQVCSDTRIAELRIYPTKALSETECYRLGATLSSKYGINDGGVARFSTTGGEIAGAAAPATPAATSYEWDADDLAANEDGAEITSWATKDGSTAIATKTGANSSHVDHGPTLVKNAILGHSTLRFSRSIKTALGLRDAGGNPLYGQKDFTLAVVFRTSDTETQGNGSYSAAEANVSGDGIFGMRTYSYATDDCGITYHRHGSLSAAWGGSGKYAYTLRPLFLNDNEPHVAVLSRDGTNGTYIWMVDGIRIVAGNSASTTLTADTRYPLLFGVICSEQDYGFFEGEIAAARVYTQALTQAEMRGLCAYYARKYGFKLAGQMPVEMKDVAVAGLSATNITVAAGAVLKLPVASATPFTIRPGVSLNGAGTVTGTVRYGEESVFDLAAARPQIEDLQLAGCTIKAAASPVDGSAIGSISGEVVIDGSVRAEKLLPKNPVLTNVPPAAIAPGTTFTVAGLRGSTIFAEYHEPTCTIRICRPTGLMVIVK